MPIITLKHNGRIYQRQIEQYKKGVYIMHSKGVQYCFRKDSDVKTNNGWHLVNGTTLPEFMMELISKELEELASHPWCVSSRNSKPFSFHQPPLSDMFL